MPRALMDLLFAALRLPNTGSLFSHSPRYTFTNLQVDHAWTRQLSVRLRMNNILNSKYHQGFVGFQSVGIHTTVDVLYFR
jgi:hypothetical protein